MITWQPTLQNVAVDLMLMNPSVSVPELVTAATKNKQIFDVKITVGF